MSAKKSEILEEFVLCHKRDHALTVKGIWPIRRSAHVYIECGGCGNTYYGSLGALSALDIHFPDRKGVTRD